MRIRGVTMNESSTDTRFRLLRCPRCAPSKAGALFQRGSERLECTEPDCGMVYPIHEGVAVMLTFEGDFYHLRKALDPAEQRVNRQVHE